MESAEFDPTACGVVFTVDRAPQTRRDAMTKYAKILGARLRTVRQRAGMSLERVQRKSGDRWKAVVVGSYERGDRAVSVQKLAELARFYGVPMSELLPPDDLDLGADVSTPLVLNLERLRELPEQDTEPVVRWCGHRAPAKDARDLAADPFRGHRLAG